MVSKLEWAARRTRMRTIVGIGVSRLAAGLATGRVRELWIGDSHAVLLNTDRFPLWLAPLGDGRFIWHLGPRIMHSVATNGFPPLAERSLRRLRRLPAARRLTCLVSFGEIDVRCHLADRLGPDGTGMDASWVSAYVDRAVALGETIGAARTVIVAPPPPSDEIADHAMFPIVGDIAARTAAHRWLCDALAAAVPADDPRVSLLDLRPALADADGRLPADLTDDGCHTNETGRAAVRRLVLDHLSTRPTAQEAPQ